MRLRLKASEFEGFDPPPLLLWLRQISIGMGEAPLQFRHLLLSSLFLPFFGSKISYLLSVFGMIVPLKKQWVVRVGPNICRVYKYLSLLSGPQNYLMLSWFITIRRSHYVGL